MSSSDDEAPQMQSFKDAKKQFQQNQIDLPASIKKQLKKKKKKTLQKGKIEKQLQSLIDEDLPEQ